MLDEHPGYPERAPVKRRGMRLILRVLFVEGFVGGVGGIGVLIPHFGGEIGAVRAGFVLTALLLLMIPARYLNPSGPIQGDPPKETPRCDASSPRALTGRIRPYDCGLPLRQKQMDRPGFED